MVSSTFTPSASGGAHHYVVESGFFPPCFTREEANHYLQRFNAPTEAALRGNGNPEDSTEGWVVDPVANEVPVGRVTFVRQMGKVVNTTQVPHPFVGTITGELLSEGGRFYVRFTGNGATAPPEQSFDSNEPTKWDWLDPVGASGMWLSHRYHPVDNARNYLNAEAGPDIFVSLANLMVRRAFEEGRQACGHQPRAFNAEP